MHHALYVEEILLNIFRFCYVLVYRSSPRPTRRRWYANIDIAALARTCKTFKEPALDMIWAELDDLTPLVRCLPQTSWVKSAGVYSLKKRLERSEWDIILGYTHRVRALPRLRGSFGLSADCVEELSEPPVSMSPSIFPNLRVVGLYYPKAAVALFLRHLTSPRLTELSLSITESLGPAIDTFGEQCPSVMDFHVSDWANADTISGLLCRWQNLSSVNCYTVGLNVDAFTHLSRLRNLSNLALKLHDAVLDRISPSHSSTPTLNFSALRGFRLNSVSLTSVWRLFNHLRVPEIHDIFINLHACPTASDLMSFFVALQEACPHNTNTLSSLLLHVYEPEDGSTLHNPPQYYITFDRLRPLTVFVNITSITLDIHCGVDLNEHGLLCLASSWPHLEELEVGADYDWTVSSAITPEGFLQLLERCRSLRVLYIMLDTRGYTEIPQGHPWRGLAMPKNTFIHLLNSPIEKESIEALGVFFHVAPYPDFNLSTHWNNRYFKGSKRSQELCNLYYNRWVSARTLALNLWEKRRDLRCSLETR